MSALAEESQGSGDSIALARLALHATEADAATWSRALLEAWKIRQERSLFILENAGAIAEDENVVALIGDLLAARPVERILLISSRVELPLPVSRYLAPHQIVTLSKSELRLDGEDAFGIFDGTDLAPRIVERIVRLADGWPSALLILARVAHYEADIEKLLDRLDEIPVTQLHEYLLNEVLSALTPDMMSAMLAVAAIPHASIEDISVSTGIRHVTPVIEGLLRLPGFISSEAGAHHMHPLLLETLHTRHETDFSEYLARAAHENERLGDFIRAAELYSICNDEKAAASALDQLPLTVLHQPSPRLVEVLTKVPMATLCSYPNLWIATLRYRRQDADRARLYDEAVILQRSVSPESAPALHRRLSVRVAMLAQELERLTEARATLDAAGTGDSAGETPEERRLVLMCSAVVSAKQGRFAEAERFLEEADSAQGARHIRFDAERAQIAMERARLHGDWNDLLKMSEDSLSAAQHSGPTARIVEATRNLAWAAWYSNDDDRVSASQQLLKDCGDVGAFAFEPIALWHAALEHADAEQAKNLFELAIAGIDQTENDFHRIAIRVCEALLLPTERRRLLEARVIAQGIESPPLQASIELLIDSPEPSDYGIFRNMATRTARSPLKVRRDILFLDIIRGQVRRGANVLHVSDRGFELLVALALFPAGTSKEELATAIWPALDAKSALNSLKMCVSRTRAQVADKDVIQSTRNGYSLSERAVIDVRELERLLRGVRGAATLGESLRRNAEEAIAVAGVHQRAFATGWTWFAPHSAHLDDLYRELRMVLARDTFKRDAPGIARELGSPSNETAYASATK